MKKNKVALLTNMIAPYRIPLYSVLADQFDLLVLHGGREANRDTWSKVEALPNANVVRAWGWQIPRAKKLNGEVFDEKFIHLTPGFITHLLRFRPDALISGEMGFRSLIALAYGTIFRKPVWIWWGGTLHSERNIGPLREALRQVFTLWADHWVSYGQAATEYLLRLGVKRNQILESQNAIDEERFKTSVEPAWSIEPRPVVLHVGQFIERKGVGALLDAAANLQQRGCEFSLLLVGSGREKRTLEHRAQALGLKNVHFHPAQTPDRMPSVYRSADFLVFPTREDVWGLVANEAVLSGLPVLCSKYAGCAPELFEPENIFSPEDSNEFSQKLGAAISGRLSKADPSRLKTTEQLGCELVQELNRFLPQIRSNKRSASETMTR
ncbi:MAG TPA: glycosyltransferase family 4 protein [Candidatus Cybelea sp.]|nr:glycosyltransferase family 4 protein [Candidatus Cybelea sp.]